MLLVKCDKHLDSLPSMKEPAECKPGQDWLRGRVPFHSQRQGGSISTRLNAGLDRFLLHFEV